MATEDLRFDVFLAFSWEDDAPHLAGLPKLDAVSEWHKACIDALAVPWEDGLTLRFGPAEQVRNDDFDFGAFVRTISARLIPVIRVMLGSQDGHLAEDVVQAALVVVWQHLSAGEPIEHPAAYVRQVAIRLAWKYLAAEKKMRSGARAGAANGVAARDEFRLADLRQDLERAVATLPCRMRVILRLHLAGKTDEEIARFFKISKGTVAAQLSKARSRLRPLLGDWRGR
jgi:RNA polymerase sigma factor (sigma-70 family)